MSNTGRSSDKTLNVIIAVVIIAVLGLGVWAVIPEFKQGIENRKAEQEMLEAQQLASMTLAQAAEEEGISFDEYIQKYGLTEAGFTAETLFSEALYEMTVENFAKANGKTFDEIKAEYQLPDTVTPDMKWAGAELQIPLGAQYTEEGIAQLKAQYGEQVTAEMTFGEFSNMLMQAEMEAAATETAEGEQAATAAEGEAAAEDAEETDSSEADEDSADTEDAE